MTVPHVLAPLRIEAFAVRGAGLRVWRTGMGGARARRAAMPDGGPVVVAGFGGALSEGPRAGHVVVGSHLRSEHGREIPLDESERLAEFLRDLGLTVHIGPVVTTAGIVHGRRRAELAASGALIADMESAHLLERVTGPRAVTRVVVDTPRTPLSHPRTVPAGITALRSLRALGPGLRAWASTSITTPAVDLEV